MYLLNWFKQRRARQVCAKQLPPLLEARYGKAAHYTPQQIQRAADDAQLDSTVLPYALALFASAEHTRDHWSHAPAVDQQVLGDSAINDAQLPGHYVDHVVPVMDMGVDAVGFDIGT